MRPRILVIFGNIPLLGQERANIQVMNCLKEAGYDVLFVTHDKFGFESVQPFLNRMGLPWVEARFPRLLSRGMSMRQWAQRLRDISLNNYHVWRAIKRFRPTHLHIANETHFIALLPLLAATRLPVIYRLGDEPRTHRTIYRWLWRRVFAPRVTHFVCISQFIRERLHCAGVADARVSVIYNYPPERARQLDEGALAQWPGPTIVYIGQLTRAKGVDILFEVAVELCRERPTLRFVFAGDYSWKNDFATALIQRAAEQGLTNCIVFPGYVEDVPALLKASTVHACPSVWEEPLGNVVVEAKQAGVPSVVFPSGGLPELIEHGVDGFVCASKTQEALADGLQHYLDADADYVRVAGAAAKASLKRLGITRDRFTRSWMRVYEQCS